MKLEVGMYVRTIDNGIGKIDDIIGDTVVVEICDGATTYQMEHIRDYNFKYSYSIIDLIEVGDYVNGCVVCEIDIAQQGKYVMVNDNDKGWRSMYFNNQIKSIVTKEQFEAMKYVVE